MTDNGNNRVTFTCETALWVGLRNEASNSQRGNCRGRLRLEILILKLKF